MDDHVSKLEHMGKETVKKLSDVLDAARVAGVDDFHLPGFPSGTVCIDKVGQFRKLALIAEQARIYPSVFFFFFLIHYSVYRIFTRTQK